MKKTALLTLVLVSLSLTSLAMADGPTYASEETKSLVEKMIKAHGGLKKWQNAPSISYTHDMVDPRKPDDHWLSEETHQQGSRRSYSNWTADGAVLINDGNNIWAEGWKRLNPPPMMARVSYFFINMVWITQDDIANLELRESTEVPAIEEGKQFKTVRLTFTGSSPYEYFDMYIDTDTYLLRGVNYTVTDKDLFKAFGMPESTNFMGPLLKVYKEYQNVNGLKLTSRYDTYRPDGQSYGIHIVSDYDLTSAFDESKLKPPVEAVKY